MRDIIIYVARWWEKYLSKRSPFKHTCSWHDKLIVLWILNRQAKIFLHIVEPVEPVLKNIYQNNIEKTYKLAIFQQWAQGSTEAVSNFYFLTQEFSLKKIHNNMTTGYIVKHSFTIHKTQKFLKIMKNRKWKNNNNNNNNNSNNKTNDVKFKNSFYFMSEGNTCIAEPKLEINCLKKIG